MKRGITSVYPGSRNHNTTNQPPECDLIAKRPRIDETKISIRLPAEKKIEQIPPLFQACKIGDLALLKSCIQEDTNLEEKNSKGETLLHWAIKYNHANIVEYLLELGVNFETKIKNQYPLVYAMNNKRIEITKLLIRKGAHLESTNQHGKNALLSTAFLYGTHSPVIQEIIPEIAIQKGMKISNVRENNEKILKYGHHYVQPEFLKTFYNIAKHPHLFCIMPKDQQERIIMPLCNNYAPDFNDLLDLLQQRTFLLNELEKQEYDLIREVNSIILFGQCFNLDGSFQYTINSDRNYSIIHGPHRIYCTVPYLAKMFENFSYSVQWDINFSSDEKSMIEMVKEAYLSFSESLEKNDYSVQAKYYLEKKMAIFSCNWRKHVAAGVLFNDQLYIVNRGAGSSPGIYRYRIDSSKLPNDEAKLSEFIKIINEKIRPKRKNSHLELAKLKELNPELINYNELKPQRVNNCSYVSFKAVIKLLFYIIKDRAIDLARSKIRSSSFDDIVLALLDFEKIDIEKIYHAFTNFNRYATVDNYIETNRSSLNSHKWQPLQQYITENTKGSDRKKELVRYISIRLSEEEASLTTKNSSTKTQVSHYPAPLPTPPFIPRFSSLEQDDSSFVSSESAAILAKSSSCTLYL